MSEDNQAVVVSESAPQLDDVDRMKISVYTSEPSQALASRLVNAEKQNTSLREILTSVLRGEQSELARSKEDLDVLATKLGSVLKDNVSRANHQHLLEELSGARKEIANLKQSNPLLQDNLDLRRRIAELELRLEGRTAEADVRARANAELSSIERAEARARNQPALRDEEYFNPSDET